MAGTTRAMVATNIWTARIIPVVMLGLMAYATYVIVGPLSVDYLISKHNNKSAAIAILVTYFLVLIIMLVTFLRLLHITYTEPSYVPLGPAAIRDREASEKRHIRKSEKTDSIGGGEYTSNGDEMETPPMEMFYTKDMFVTEMDGKPKWCTHCANWKPDRAHHCSSSGRCITRMDHFCPWVGGPVGENNFKFFIQFTGYCALYCLHIGIVMAIYVHKQRTSPNESLNPHVAVALGLSVFFGLFTAGMTATSCELAIRNQTQVERLGAETRIHIFAIIKPPNFTIPPIQHQDGPVLSYPELTYPLGGETPSEIPQNSPSNGADPSEQSSISPNTNNQNVSSSQDQRPPTRDLSTGSTVVAADGRLPSSHAAKKSSQAQWPSQAIAKRDQAATRTFLILKMPEPGYNPWDLGSSLLNWESVMGYSVIDWLLPFKRSPCCNHEEDESHYQVGPMVDILRAKYGLIPESEIRAYGGRKRDEKLDPRDYPSAQRMSIAQEQAQEEISGSKKRRRRKTSKEETVSDQPSIEMRSMNNRT